MTRSTVLLVDDEADILASLSLQLRKDHKVRTAKNCEPAKQTVRGLRVVDLEVGMRVAEDIVATNNLVLIGRGMIVTDLLLDRLHNYAKIIDIVEPVLAIPGVLRPIETLLDV